MGCMEWSLFTGSKFKKSSIKYTSLINLRSQRNTTINKLAPSLISYYTILILVGGVSEWGRIKMASASTPSANEPAKDLILVHTVELKPMIKAHISVRMVSVML